MASDPTAISQFTLRFRGKYRGGEKKMSKKKRGRAPTKGANKADKDACGFDKFGVWSWEHPELHPEGPYEPPAFVLKPLSPDHWHELPKLITPEMWQRAERNRLQALENLYENGHIGYEEKCYRQQKGEIF